tara:strand:+ start:1174 stop:2394 length:1221 start_codon:yes stop_codon:yes gene_type:complete
MDNNLNIIFDKNLQKQLTPTQPTDFYPASNWFNKINISDTYTNFNSYKKNYYYLYAQDWHALVNQQTNFLSNIDPDIIRLMQYNKIQPMLIFMEPVELFDFNKLMSKNFIYDNNDTLYSKIVTKFDEFDILEDDIVFLHSSPKVVSDYEQLTTQSIPFLQRPWNIRAKIIHHPMFLNWYKYRIGKDYDPNIQSKFRMLSPGKTYRRHRYLLQYALSEIKNNELKITCNPYTDTADKNEIAILKNESLSLDMADTIENFEKRCPISLDKDIALVLTDRKKDSSFFSQADLIIPSETLMENNTCICMSEKTLTPIFLQRPFIMNAHKNFLAMLRGYNLQTFDGIIDETYDKFEGVERIKLIKQEVLRLLEYDNNKWNKFILDCKDISSYNYKTIQNTDYEQKTIEQLC